MRRDRSGFGASWGMLALVDALTVGNPPREASVRPQSRPWLESRSQAIGTLPCVEGHLEAQGMWAPQFPRSHGHRWCGRDLAAGFLARDRFPGLRAGWWLFHALKVVDWAFLSERGLERADLNVS